VLGLFSSMSWWNSTPDDRHFRWCGATSTPYFAGDSGAVPTPLKGLLGSTMRAWHNHNTKTVRRRQRRHDVNSNQLIQPLQKPAHPLLHPLTRRPPSILRPTISTRPMPMRHLPLRRPIELLMHIPRISPLLIELLLRRLRLRWRLRGVDVVAVARNLLLLLLLTCS